MNMVNEGVLPPDELDDRDERREEQERARSREIERHYNRAKERHPYFCDRITCLSDVGADTHLSIHRHTLASEVKAGQVEVGTLLYCEFYEAMQAYTHGDIAAAVEECYDAIAVLLRTIDVLEGRQQLGREGGAQ